MTQDAQSSYDRVPYGNHAFFQTHPRRIAAAGRIFGLATPAVENCRVLELGCASGGNLLPMGCALPHADFTGIDLSPRQIEEGNAMVRELGLPNVHLRCVNIMDVDAAFGRFDFIICHGVYSWVPAVVQDKVLRICHDNLNPNGVAMVSFNALPGSHARQALREMMLYHTRRHCRPSFSGLPGTTAHRPACQVATDGRRWCRAAKSE